VSEERFQRFRETAQRRERVSYLGNVAVAISFLVFNCMNVYIAIKCLYSGRDVGDAARENDGTGWEERGWEKYDDAPLAAFLRPAKRSD
jgi:hypothetical protein